MGSWDSEGIYPAVVIASNVSLVSCTWKYSSTLIRQWISRGLGISIKQARNWWRQLVKASARSLAGTQRRHTSSETAHCCLRGTGKKNISGPGTIFLLVCSPWTLNPRSLMKIILWFIRSLFTGLYSILPVWLSVTLRQGNWLRLLYYLLLQVSYTDDKQRHLD